MSTLLVAFLAWRALAVLPRLPGLLNPAGLTATLAWPLSQRIRMQLADAAEGHASAEEAWKLHELLLARTGTHAVVLARFGSEKTVLRFVFALQNATFPRTVMRASSAADLDQLRAMAAQQGRDEFYAVCLAGAAEEAWRAGAERVGTTTRYELWRLAPRGP